MPQRVALVVGRLPTGLPQTDTYYVVRNRQPAHLAVPVIAVVFWTVVSVWLLGARDRGLSPAEQEPSGTKH